MERTKAFFRQPIPVWVATLVAIGTLLLGSLGTLGGMVLVTAQRNEAARQAEATATASGNATATAIAEANKQIASSVQVYQKPPEGEGACPEFHEGDYAKYLKDLPGFQDGDPVRPGAAFTSIRRYQNCGGSTWKAGEVFITQLEGNTACPVKITLDQNVQPNQIIDITMTCVMPGGGLPGDGLYFMFQNSGNQFPQRFWVKPVLQT